MKSLRNVGFALIGFIAILVIFGIYESYFTATSAIGELVSNNIYYKLETYANSNFSYSFTPSSIDLSTIKTYNASYIARYSGKPDIIYIGAEWCPYCAVDRWALTITLLRFGNLSGLEYMLSSSSDIYPNTPTFTFANSTYISKYISFVPYEFENREGEPLATPPYYIQYLWKELGNKSIPFVYVGGYYYQTGTIINPGLINGKSWNYALNQLGSNTEFAKEVYTEANMLTAEICKIDGNQPSNVCKNPTIIQIEKMLSVQSGEFEIDDKN
jgi:thiol-disulfide isomerase/thioredoxin